MKRDTTRRLVRSVAFRGVARRAPWPPALGGNAASPETGGHGGRQDMQSNVFAMDRQTGKSTWRRRSMTTSSTSARIRTTSPTATTEAVPAASSMRSTPRAATPSGPSTRHPTTSGATTARTPGPGSGAHPRWTTRATSTSAPATPDPNPATRSIRTGRATQAQTTSRTRSSASTRTPGHALVAQRQPPRPDGPRLPELADPGDRDAAQDAHEDRDRLRQDRHRHRRLGRHGGDAVEDADRQGPERRDEGVSAGHNRNLPRTLGGVESPIAFGDGKVFVPCIDFSMFPTPTTAATAGHVDVSQATGGFAAIDAATGPIVWDNEVDAIVVAGAAVFNDVVLPGSLDGYLRTYDAETGKQVWEFAATAGLERAARRCRRYDRLRRRCADLSKPGSHPKPHRVVRPACARQRPRPSSRH